MQGSSGLELGNKIWLFGGNNGQTRLADNELVLNLEDNIIKNTQEDGSILLHTAFENLRVKKGRLPCDMFLDRYLVMFYDSDPETKKQRKRLAEAAPSLTESHEVVDSHTDCPVRVPDALNEPAV